ncbi:elements of external origin [Tritonibacter mobilis]|uniref:elements of external origin n=1 Tax=Tritonibacter mobilis TaxID=379347 RepID=UPI0039A5BAF6
MRLSRRQYAKSRKARGLSGGSESAVRKAIRDGRITVEDDNKIDPDKADKLWSATTEVAKQRSEKAIVQGIENALAKDDDETPELLDGDVVRVVEEFAPEGDDSDSHSMTYARARAANEAVKSQMNELRLKALQKKLISRENVVAQVYDLARKERDSWMQMPARTAANMAAELGVDAHTMERVLDQAIRDHLAELAEIKLEFGDS